MQPFLGSRLINSHSATALWVVLKVGQHPVVPVWKPFTLAYRSNMETNSPPSTSAMPPPHHPYWATSEGAGSQSAPDTHSSSPILYSQPPVNFTELPPRSYAGPSLVDTLACQCQQRTMSLPFRLQTNYWLFENNIENRTLPTFLELPLSQRDLSDNRNINDLFPTSLYYQNHDHRMKLSIPYHGNPLADDGKYATLVGAKVKPRGIRISDYKAKDSGSKPPTKTL